MVVESFTIKKDGLIIQIGNDPNRTDTIYSGAVLFSFEIGIEKECADIPLGQRISVDIDGDKLRLLGTDNNGDVSEFSVDAFSDRTEVLNPIAVSADDELVELGEGQGEITLTQIGFDIEIIGEGLKASTAYYLRFTNHGGEVQRISVYTDKDGNFSYLIIGGALRRSFLPFISAN